MKNNLRISLAKAKGLGAARNGTQHFWIQRLTALANVPLYIFFIVLIVLLTNAEYPFVLNVLSNPLVAFIMSLMIFSSIYHMKLGMQVIIEDYIPQEGWRTLALVLNIFFSIVVGTACIFAMLHIMFGSHVNG